jgi:uncharacterized protein (TIGR00255 family)
MRSMTGYGGATAEAPAARLTVEIRGVNQRFLDVKVNLPREYLAWESEVRERVRAAVARGRVDVSITRSALARRRRYRVRARRELARAYLAAARKLARDLHLAGDVPLAEILRLPDLFEVGEEAAPLDGELALLRRTLGAALARFVRARRREGATLAREMRRRVARLAQLTRRMRRVAPAAQRALRAQMQDRLANLAAATLADPARLAHEVVLWADRADVTEEMVRLEAHRAALAEAIGAPGPAGKRIEFLLQEVHRELNTAGDKAGDLRLSDLVLAAKGEVEKLREQVQNVE